MKMKKWMTAMALLVLLTTGCVKETVYVEPASITDADLYYEFVADNIGTIVKGDLYNDGDIYINAV